MNFRHDQFVIICPARSGSTMLVHLLRSHPQIWCNGEVFLEGWRLGSLQGNYAILRSQSSEVGVALEREMNRDLVRFLYKFVLDPQSRKVAGFKFKWDEFVLPSYAPLRKALVEDKDLKILFLTRRNLLARYVSYRVALDVTGITYLKEESKRPEIDRISLEPEACEQDFQETLERELFVRDAFSQHRLLDIYYEDLLLDRVASQKKICQFLDVDYSEMSTTTLKILDRDLSLVVSNLDEILAYFKGGPLEKRIGSLSAPPE